MSPAKNTVGSLVRRLAPGVKRSQNQKLWRRTRGPQEALSRRVEVELHSDVDLNRIAISFGRCVLPAIYGVDRRLIQPETHRRHDIDDFGPSLLINNHAQNDGTGYRILVEVFRVAGSEPARRDRHQVLSFGRAWDDLACVGIGYRFKNRCSADQSVPIGRQGLHEFLEGKQHRIDAGFRQKSGLARKLQSKTFSGGILLELAALGVVGEE